MTNKQHNKIFLLFILLLSLTFTLNTTPVFAQEEEEEFEEGEEGEEMEEDENAENGDETMDEEDEGNNDEDEITEDNFETADLHENEEGIDDPTGMYKLDEITAETFQKISNIERENALMKLRIEQGKLKLDLEKQKAEKKKIAASILEEERTRKIKQQEQERKIAQEQKKLEEEEEKLQAEKKERQQKKELQDKLMTKINSADLSNSDDVQALTQLMSVVTGNTIAKKEKSDLGSARSKGEEEEVPFDKKYSLKSVIGAGGNLIANIENLEKKSTFKARKGSVIDGWYVEDVKGTSVLLKRDGKVKVMNLN